MRDACSLLLLSWPKQLTPCFATSSQAFPLFCLSFTILQSLRPVSPRQTDRQAVSDHASTRESARSLTASLPSFLPCSCCTVDCADSSMLHADDHRHVCDVPDVSINHQSRACLAHKPTPNTSRNLCLEQSTSCTPNTVTVRHLRVPDTPRPGPAFRFSPQQDPL